MPPIDVIVPLYNNADTVGETLDSLASQTDTGWRAVVVNDGSTDEGPAVVAGRAARDPRIATISQPNAGIAAARNAGLDARPHGEPAPLVMFLDADDTLEPDALARLRDAVDADPQAAGAYGGFGFFDAAMRPLGREVFPETPSVGLHDMKAYCPLIMHSCITRRAAIGSIRFDPTFGVGEDFHFWLRLAEAGAAWSSTGTFVARYRCRDGSRSKDFDAMARNEAALIRRAHAACGPPGTGIDRALGRSALGYAARAAMSDHEHGIARATRTFDDLGRRWRATADDLAQAAVFAMLFGLGLRPDELTRPGRPWLGRLAALHRELGDRLAPDASRWTAVRNTLAEKLVHPRDAAALLIAEATERLPAGVRYWAGRAGPPRTTPPGAPPTDLARTWAEARARAAAPIRHALESADRARAA